MLIYKQTEIPNLEVCIDDSDMNMKFNEPKLGSTYTILYHGKDIGTVTTYSSGWFVCHALDLMTLKAWIFRSPEEAAETLFWMML